MNIVINPGTGPVAGADLETARVNMGALVVDVDVSGAEVERKEEWAELDENGRFYFNVVLGSRVCEVEMPGLPLERVRFVSAEGQNIWDFPRLYVDGSSWVWKYAVSVLSDHLTRNEDDEE